MRRLIIVTAHRVLLIEGEVGGAVRRGGGTAGTDLLLKAYGVDMLSHIVVTFRMTTDGEKDIKECWF